METLISNINGVQRRTRGKRSFLVAPASLIVPGVLNGSKGKLFYPQDEVQKVVDPWNGMPVVVYHPTVKGQPISGRHPDVFDVGRVYNTKWNGKLTAEAWIDEELLLGVDQGAAIRDRLLRGDKIEVSTGLYTENEQKAGVDPATGQPYDYIARNYRPDHLAILPDQRGACSLNDGCGLNVNAENVIITNMWDYEDDCLLTNAKKAKLTGGRWVTTESGNHVYIKDGKVAAGNPKVVEAMKSKKGDKKTGGESDLTPAQKTIADKMVAQATKAAKQFRRQAAKETDPTYKAKLLKDAHRFETLIKKHASEGAKKQLVKNSNSEDDMTKDQLVNWLITNSGVYTEEDRATLNTTDMEKLKKMKDKMEPGKKEGCTCNDKPTGNAAQTPATTPVVKPMTGDEWLKAAPPEWVSVLNNAKNIELQERQRLANAMVANTENKEARESAYKVYMGMPLDTLRTLAATIPSAPVGNQTQANDQLAGLQPYGQQPYNPASPLYFGAGGGPVTNLGPTGGVTKNDTIPVAEIDWAELSKETMKHGTVVAG